MSSVDELPNLSGYTALVCLPIAENDKGQAQLVELYRAKKAIDGTEWAIRRFVPELAADPLWWNDHDGRLTAFVERKHGHIARVEKVGTEEHRIADYATEWCELGSLRELREQWAPEPLPLALVVSLFHQLASALAHLHAADLTHGNLKPSNILLKKAPVSRNPKEGEARRSVATAGIEVKVADFASVPPAKLLQSKALKALRERFPNLIRLSSFQYSIAPECYQGEPSNQSATQLEMGKAGDIYTFGILLYEALTGRYPYQSRDARGHSLPPTPQEAIAAHLYDDAADARLYRGGLPDTLYELIEHCLHKEPANRRLQAGTLAEALAVIDEQLARPRDAQAAVRPPTTLLPSMTIINELNEQRRLPISGDGLLLKRDEQVLSSEEIPQVTLRLSEAPQQMRVLWDGLRILLRHEGVTDDPPIWLGSRQLWPTETAVWEWDQELHVGSSVLTLTQPVGFAEPPPVAPPPEPQAALLWRGAAQANPRLSLHVAPPVLVVAPNTPTTLRLTIENHTTVNESVRVRVEGLASPQAEQAPLNPAPGPAADAIEQLPAASPAWFPDSASIAPILLNLGTVETLITVQVPLGAGAVAGHYQAIARARSEVDGTEVGQPFEVVIQPVMAHTIDVRPRRRFGALGARYVVTLRNKGNVPTRYNIVADDDGRLLDCTPDQRAAQVEPGSERQIRLAVQPYEPYWFGPDQTQLLTIRATPTAGDPLSVPATFVQRPIIPRWLPLLLLAIVGLILLRGYLFRDRWMDHQALAELPLYAIFNPFPTTAPTPETPAPTAAPSPTIDPALIAAFILPTASPTTTPTPTTTATPAPPSPTPTPTIPTPVPTSFPIDPASGLRLCPAQDQALLLTGSGEPGTAIELHFDDRRIDLGVWGDPERLDQRFRVGADGRFAIPLLIGDERPGPHAIMAKTISGVIYPTDQYPQLRCFLQ